VFTDHLGFTLHQPAFPKHYRQQGCQPVFGHKISFTRLKTFDMDLNHAQPFSATAAHAVLIILPFLLPEIQ
jgi:hypothetical protein